MFGKYLLSACVASVSLTFGYKVVKEYRGNSMSVTWKDRDGVHRWEKVPRSGWKNVD